MLDWSNMDIEFAGGDIAGEQESIIDLLLYELTCGTGTFSNLPEMGLSLGDVLKTLTTDMYEIKNMIYLKLSAAGIQISLEDISATPGAIVINLSDTVTVTISEKGVRARKVDPIALQDRSQTYNIESRTNNPILDRRSL